MKDLPKILFVEDSENDIELTIAALRECNLNNPIEIVRNGEDALDFLYNRGKFSNSEDCLPIVILLDLKMPKVNGIEVLETIKTDGKLKSIPVVILTSSSMSEDIKRCYELGANAFVVKPINAEDFIKSIKNIGVFWALVNKTMHE